MTRLDQELDRIAEREPEVRAWAHLAAADTLREAWAAARGPLQGFTLGVKDIVDTADLPAERGSPIYAGRRPSTDAACVALARRAGAVILGKTVTTEFAVLTPAATRNPHDLARTPGGSSSGSAAAVADGMVRVAFGSQTAGSVIRPAAFCGVVGFKPTYQAVPLAGVSMLAPSLDTLGWFGRDVADVAALWRVLGPASPDAEPAGALGPATPASLSGRRIGLYRTHEPERAEPAVHAALDQVATALRALGAEVRELEPLAGAHQLADAAGTIMLAEAARTFAWERTHHDELLSAGLRSLLAQGDVVDAAAYAAAQRAAVAGRHQLEELTAAGSFGLLLTPSAPGEAPTIDSTGDPRFCRIWTMLGVPTLHLPTGSGPAGLPIGVQLVGRRWAEAELLALAAATESALDR